MIQRILENSRFCLGLTITKYDSTLLSYLRFMAKNHMLQTLRLNRINKLYIKNKVVRNLFSGPVLLLYSIEGINLAIFERIKEFENVELVFIKFNNIYIIQESFSLMFNKIEHNLRLSLQLILSINYIINILSKINLISLIHAYNKSINK